MEPAPAPAAPAPVSRPWGWWAAFGVLTLLVLAFYFPLLAGGKMYLFGHLLDHTIPPRAYLHEALRAGHLPLWHPWQQAGTPLLATGQAGVLYPPNLLLLLAFPAVRAMQLYLVLHVLLAGWGMLWLARRLGLSPTAAALAAIAAAFCAQTVCHFVVVADVISTLVWFPFLLVVVEGWRRRAFRGWPWALVPLFALQITAGHIQLALSSALVCGLHLLLRLGLPQDRDALRRSAGALARFAATGALGGLLAAAHLLPCLELLGQSDRQGGLSLATSLQHSMPPAHVLRFLFPDLFGFKTPDLPRAEPYWFGGSMNTYWDSCPYIGIGLFAVWLCALVRPPRSADGRLCWGLSLVALLFSLGAWGGLWVLLHYVPPFGFFRAPSRFLGFLVPYAVLLAGLRLDAWRNGAAVSRRERWVLAGVAALLLVIGAGVSLGYRDLAGTAQRLEAWTAGTDARRAGALRPAIPRPPEEAAQAYLDRNSLRSPQVLAGVLSLGLLAAWWAAGERGRRRLAPAVAALLALDLVWYAARYNVPRPVTDLEVFDRLTTTLRRAAPDLDESYVLAAFPAQPLAPEHYPAMLPHYAAATGRWRLFNNFSAVQLGRYRSFEATLYEQLQRADYSTALLEKLGIHYVVCRLPIRSANYAPLADRPLHLYRVRGAPAYCRSPVRFDVVRGECREPGRVFDLPVEIVLLETLAASPPAAPVAANAAAAVRRLERGYDRLDLEVYAPRKATYVLHEVQYPGWRVAVDGRRVEPMRANRLFLAVDLEQGVRRIELRYRSRPFEAGLALGAVALCIFAAGTVWSRRRPQSPGYFTANSTSAKGETPGANVVGAEP